MNPRERIERHAPWLLEPGLGVCVVGTSALAEACERAGIEGPKSADLDLSWDLELEVAKELLSSRACLLPTSAGSQERGTLAFRLQNERVEITSFRNRALGGTLAERIQADLEARDMTVGAVAWLLAENRIIDPLEGVHHWNEERVVPVGDALERVREHPSRWIRYYRKAQEWGFGLASSIRKLEPDAELLARIPAEAISAELRAALLRSLSPGRFFQELHEGGLLRHLAPELDTQFDGRPAGPVRHHPEVSQALHMILALEWAVLESASLPEPERIRVLLAVLCHDLGKGLTEGDAFPSHHGHERAGIEPIRRLFARLPALGSTADRRFCEQVSLLHLEVRHLRELRPGTLARLYEDHFRRGDFRVDLFALAVGADSGGRLGLSEQGRTTMRQVQADLAWMQRCCESVDAAQLREEMSEADTESFRQALHQAHARALKSGS